MALRTCIAAALLEVDMAGSCAGFIGLPHRSPHAEVERLIQTPG